MSIREDEGPWSEFFLEYLHGPDIPTAEDEGNKTSFLP